MKCSLVLLFLIISVSCRLDYGGDQLTDELSDDIPDTILFEVVHTIVRDGSPRFRVVADRVETYSDRDRQYLSGVEFRELNPDGTVKTSGVANHAEYRVDTEDVELTGNLMFYSEEEEAWLTADYLYWSSDARRLTSVPENPVTVRKADGTRVVGRGFVAEMSRTHIYFQDGVSGTIVEEEEAAQANE